MMWYEIYKIRETWEVWKWTPNGNAERVKVFKTLKSVENWAKKQWCKVVWP